MPASKKSTHATRIDPDDASELTDEWFEKAELHHGEKLVHRGRPKSAAPNVAVSLRIPLDVLERWKSTGPAGRRAWWRLSKTMLLKVAATCELSGQEDLLFLIEAALIIRAPCALGMLQEP